MRHFNRLSTLFWITLFSFTSFSDSRSQFGSHGQNGYSGASGRDGMDGRDQTVFVDGPRSVFVSGSDGEDGRNGSNGQPAYGCHQPVNVPENMYGASGGDGGHGGSGGRGGSGGNTTLYYEDPNLLKQIYIDASSGFGGRSGYAGGGGSGCYCSQSQWQVNGVTYSCQNGQHGMNGSHGSNGSSGTMGSIKVIPQLTPLLPVRPTLTADFLTIANTKPLLSNNRWTTMTGARNLIAPNSKIQDRYTLYKGRIESMFTVDWKANRPIDAFAKIGCNLFLENEYAHITLPSDVWMNATYLQDGPNTVFQVQGALFTKEIAAFSFKGTKGIGSGFEASFVDQSGYPDWIDTSFHVAYYSRSGLFLKKRFEGTLNPNLVTKNGNAYYLSIGKLPISAEYFTSGTKMRVEITAYRKFANKTMSLAYEDKGTIGE